MNQINIKRQKQNRHRGFSIMELLLVLVILAILAGIVGVRFVGVSGDAKIKAANTQMKNFETALDGYELTQSTFPTTNQGLEALVEKPSAANDDWSRALNTDAVPQDPWGNDYQYRYPGQEDEEGYDLWSNGPDGQDGTEDDITNWTRE